MKEIVTTNVVMLLACLVVGGICCALGIPFEGCMVIIFVGILAWNVLQTKNAAIEAGKPVPETRDIVRKNCIPTLIGLGVGLGTVHICRSSGLSSLMTMVVLLVLGIGIDVIYNGMEQQAESKTSLPHRKRVLTAEEEKILAMLTDEERERLTDLDLELFLEIEKIAMKEKEAANRN